MKFKVIIASLFCLFLFGCQNGNQKTLGILVPIENKSLDEMVKGFIDSVKHVHPEVTIKVSNAQGDMNTQHAIINQMKNNTDIIIPIGTGATQMALAIAPESTIVSLASNISESDRSKLKSCHVAIVHDEIPPQQILRFIHQLYPTITQLTLIHSATDKVYEDVKKTVAAGETLGIQIKPAMINNLNDLYSVTQNIDPKTQGIFILKDLMVASGIATIVQQAEKNQIPIFASDQGSVQDGATLALGVHEVEVGQEGATLANKILEGQTACDLPIVDMTKLTIFVNQKSFMKTKLNPNAIPAVADKLGYRIENVVEKVA